MSLTIILSDLVHSKSKLKTIFLSNLILNLLYFIMIKIFGLINSLYDSYTLKMNDILYNQSIIYNLYAFFFFLCILLNLLTIISIVNFITYYIEKNRKDIAIMKTSGTTKGNIILFFYIPMYFLFLIGALVSLGVPWLITYLFFNNLPDTPISLLFFFLYLISSLFTIGLSISVKISRMFKRNVSTLLKNDLNLDFLSSREPSFFKRIVSRFGKYASFSYKNITKKKKEFYRMFLLLTFACLVTGVLFTSSFVINSTYRNNVGKSLGGNEHDNIILIGHKNITGVIENSYKSFYSLEDRPSAVDDMQNYTFDYQDINLTLFEDKIVCVDWRMVLYIEVFEQTGVEITGPEPGSYKVWGQDRSCNAIIFGVDLNNELFNDWTSTGPLNFGNGGSNVIIGDSIAGTMFDNIEYQKLEILGKSFPISTQVFDSANNGYSIYMDYEALLDKLGLNTSDPYHNCAFIKVKDMDATERAQLINQVDQHVNSTLGVDFHVIDLEPTFTQVMKSLDYFMIIHVLLASFVLAFVILLQLEFLKIVTRANWQDFKIMHAIGLKQKQVQKIIFDEFLILLILAMLLAFAVNLIFNSIFLISDVFLPPLYVPMLIFAASFLLLSGINWVLLKVNFRSRNFNYNVQQ
ncbi:MAG: FtsX-like permease family protein [Candidatus Hodarchaeota archaeon]